MHTNVAKCCHYSLENIVNSRSGLPLRLTFLCVRQHPLKCVPCVGFDTCPYFVEEIYWQALTKLERNRHWLESLEDPNEM